MRFSQRRLLYSLCSQTAGLSILSIQAETWKKRWASLFIHKRVSRNRWRKAADIGRIPRAHERSQRPTRLRFQHPLASCRLERAKTSESWKFFDLKRSCEKPALCWEWLFSSILMAQESWRLSGVSADVCVRSHTQNRQSCHGPWPVSISCCRTWGFGGELSRAVLLPPELAERSSLLSWNTIQHRLWSMPTERARLSTGWTRIFQSCFSPRVFLFCTDTICPKANISKYRICYLTI